MNVLSMTNLELSGKRVLIREDLNVPVKDGKVTSDARIRAALPTIEHARKAGAKVILMSHLGRPTEGEFADEFSMLPVATHLGGLLDTTVPVINDWKNGVTLHDGDVVLLENVRFNIGEKKDAEDLAKAYAELCDIFVMDAFGTAHRAQASTHGVAKFAPIACAGPLLVGELTALEKALANPTRPIKTEIPVPSDVVTGKEFSETATASLKSASDVEADDMIFDIGPDTSAELAKIIANAKTILWNGPVGVFEFDQFGEGTKALSLAIADSAGFSIAGGGDTLAAVDKYEITDKVSYISTGGGAFLEYVEGKVLPAVAILEERAK